jgi:hypothetical protein
MEAHPGVALVHLWATGSKQQMLQRWVDVMGVRALLQMLYDVFEVFT